MPVLTLQKAQALVQVSPIIINVACFLLQHSLILGQEASSQTVKRLFFLRKGDVYKIVADAKPDVFNHNLETIPRLYLKVRPGSRYFQSLDLLKKVKDYDSTIFTKSGLMVGLGETKEEIMQVMDDLRIAGVDFLTIGQYLQPSTKHFPIKNFITPEEFESYKLIAEGKGFLLVSSSPLTRSSYHASEDFDILKKKRINKLI